MPLQNRPLAQSASTTKTWKGGFGVSIDFRSIRSLNNSQDEGFEELCCQLAGYEPAPQGSTFYRKAPPDAGVECYWQLPNGDEWGWQAKFFSSPPNKTQWSEIDDSVKTALEKHPQLTLYTVCLPIDRQDPRTGQKWFMDRWRIHAEKWNGWAQKKSMLVEFKYWGRHEIYDRLTRDEHRGRRFYWFNEEFFTQQWFEDRANEAVAIAGARYTPELNVELPVAGLFAGLGRTSEFCDELRALHGKIKRTCMNAESRKAQESAQSEHDSLHEHLHQLISLLERAEESEIRPIDFDSIAELTSRSTELAWNYIRRLETATKEGKRKTVSSEASEAPASHNRLQDLEGFEYSRYYLYEQTRDLSELQGFAQSNKAHLANVPALLLVGNAGTGKTHLLCDIAQQRIHAGLPTLLLLGAQFTPGEPWSQIIRLLGLSGNRDDLLGALEASAQAKGSKAIILIDALNEGEGRYLWGKHLAGMLVALSRYPWVSIAVSVRTSYENIVIPSGLVPNRLVREEHSGFAGFEYKATQTFFNHYGIEQPSVPLLVPEFQNPLFLKLFCQGLNNLGLHRIPTGLRGITAIFGFFIESVNTKLSNPEYVDFDPRSRIVQLATEKLAEMMANKMTTWLPREEARAAINSLFPPAGYDKSLFRHLISEGILTEDRFLIGENEWQEGIHFSYERFVDNLIAKYSLDKHLDTSNPSHSFSPDQPLGSLMQDESTCWKNRGLIDAFSIQLPERIRKELAEIAPYCADFRPIREAFVESLIWRKPEAITDKTLKYVNEHVTTDRSSQDRFVNALLSIALDPKHPYNADFLHKHLIKYELAKRDAWWSIFLHYQYGGQDAVDRLVDWASSPEDKSHIDDEAIRLCGVALAWFLTTPNRFLRDRATKALVSILCKRMHTLTKIIAEFLEVNDPYVLERLFAVAYGCALRSADNEAIAALAKAIYDWVFKNGTPCPHILLRDYARGVIELAIRRGIVLDIDVGKVHPPYKSKWPPFDIPAEKELEEVGEWRKDMPDEEKARLDLYDSVMGFGDFARYIIGTNSGHFDWSSRRLGATRMPSRKEMYEIFAGSLTNGQKKAWNQYLKARAKLELHKRLGELRTEVPKRVLDGVKPEEDTQRSLQSFRKTLRRKKLSILKNYVLPYLDNPREVEYRFDLSAAQRWILKKVLNLGWTVERFGTFDRITSRYDGRSAHKPERMGKKYQWIAYHEFLARVSDNFEFRDESEFDRPSKYEGPWQRSTRDIDPSCLLSRTKSEMWKPLTSTWWFPSSYDAWNLKPDDLAWLKSSKDLPTIDALIAVTNPVDGSRWLTLEALYAWEQPTPPETELFEIPRKSISYMLRSYVAKKADMDELFEWAKSRDSAGDWLPESRSLYQVFFGELFRSLAYEYYCSPYYGYEAWSRGHDQVIPKEVLVTVEKYLWEYGGYDCSIDEPLQIYLPAKWLVDRLGLQWNGIEGELLDGKGNLIAFDPSVKFVGPGALLLNWKALEFLNDAGYDILWIVTGGKDIIGGSITPDSWKGELRFSGVYRIRGSKVEGSIKTRFISRESRM
jgi:hypothetical protein